MENLVVAVTPEAEPRPTSEVLRELARRDTPSITIGELAAVVGSRVHGFALILFALPETIPLPLPSASAVLGIPLMLIAGHLCLFGDRPGMPQSLTRRQLPMSVVHFIARYGAPVLAWVEHLSRPRLAVVARRERLIGAVCFLVAVVLWLPLPFINIAPAVCLVTMALGLVQRDGLLIAVGFVLTVALIVVLALFANVIWGVVSGWFGG